MRNTVYKLCGFAVTLTLLIAGVNRVWASGGSEGTTITVYAVGGHISWASSTWDEATSTLNIDCRRQGNEDDFKTYGNAYLDAPMINTGYTYCGDTIYSYTFKELYDGAQIRLKHYKNGTWQEDYTAAWAGTSTINGKIYDGYYNSAHQWLTFGRDITIYAIPESDDYNLSTAFNPESHNLRANVKVGSTGDGEWLGTWPIFDKTSYKYQGNWIYKATVFAKYNVICQIQFWEHNGSSNVCYCDCNPGYEYAADDIDDKIFIGKIDDTPTWISYARDYKVELHNNDGRVWSDSVGSYTSGIGATLPTNVSKWGCDFDGWYDNEGLTGDPVTAIGTSETGDKDYYAKWTSIQQTYPIASHPEFLAAQEGDIIVVNITGIHTGSQIYLQDANYGAITNRSLSATGKQAFQLTAAQATALRTYGLIVTGNNFTFSDVDILYRKTIWTGTLSDNTGWAEVAVDKTIFSNLAGGDFLGLNITALGDKESYHNYAIRGDYDNILRGSTTTTGIAIEALSAAQVTALKDSNRIDVDAQYLDISNLYSYTHTRTYTVTLNVNSGTINAGNVTSYTFGTGATLPTDVTRTGYTFDGWYPDAEFAGERVYSVSTTDYGDKTYYAKWTANVYTVTLNTNSGTIHSGTVTSYTYGVGATLPTYVTKWGNKFAGWYDNSGLTGDPVTTISTSETGDKDYYAKWTSITETLAIGDYPEFLAAQEGDIIVVTVSDVQQGAQIRLNDSGNNRIDGKGISSDGKYAFQLSADAAESIHSNGLKLTGLGYSKTNLEILYRKTLKAIDLGVADSCKWGSTEIAPASDKAIFDGLTTDHYIGFEVTELCGEASGYHDYQVQCNYKNFMVSGKLTATGIHLQELEEEMDKAPLDSLQGPKRISVGSGTLSLGNLYAYTNTRTYTITLNTNSGTINEGDVDKYTFRTGATLPTNVTRNEYNFDGWYNNAALSGDPIATISTTDYGNKVYYAKWTSIKQTFTPAETPILPCAVEGDLVVVDVSAYGDGAEIVLQDKDGTGLVSQSVSATGRYPFQLTTAQAASINAGLIATGTNYTATVSVLLRKTIWNDGIDGTSAWAYEALDKSIFDGISANDFLGVTINKINGDGYYSYRIQINNSDLYEQSVSGTGTFIHQLSSAEQTDLTTTDQTITIASGNSAVSALYRYVDTREYTVELHNNGGRVKADSVGSYTFGTGATLPTYVTKWGQKFAGWYDNAELTGEPVTTISTTDYGNKHYYAKWESILQILAIGDHSEFLPLQEGDLIVVTVTDVQQGAQISLHKSDAKKIASKSISATGKYVFQLSAGAADSIRSNGLRVTGQGYTGTVAIRYRKTLWKGTLDDTAGWTGLHIANALFDEAEAGEYIGFKITKINGEGSWHQAGVYGGDNKSVSITTTTTGIYLNTIAEADLDSLQTPGGKWVAIGAQNLEISALYYYSPHKVFVIYRDGDKADDARNTPDDSTTFVGGTIAGQIEYRMKVGVLDQWYSLCLPFTVNAVKVWDQEDGAYYDLVPYYRTGGSFYNGHYVIRTPERTEDLSLANFGNWIDPESATNYVPTKNTPYVIQWHDSYFLGRYVSFFGAAGQTIPTAMTAGSAPSSDNVVNVLVNDAMVNGSVAGAYMLEGDYGTGAWLRLEDASASRTIHPFECYLLANSATRARFMAIRRDMTIDDTPTGWEDVVNSQTKSIISVYTITGCLVAHYYDCSFNEAAQRLSKEHSEGLFILRAENESVKLMMGGK